MNKATPNRAGSPSSGCVRCEPPLRRTALALLVSACFGGAHANPTLPQVVNGQATFNQQGNVFSVTNTPNTIINWQSFSVASGELTRFIQQNGNSAVLNRITGQDPSKILGALESNGKVFLINPNGILFGAGSRVDVGGLVASSLGITNQDFLAGKRSFTADGAPGSVINRGAINAAGGPVLLIAPQVENSGVITTPNGDVMLAAGHSVNLADPANPDLQVVLSAPGDQAINVGQVIAQGGRIGMYGALLNQRGVLNADSAVRGENGKIVLKASARALLENASVTSATGVGHGGEIVVLGDQVGLNGNAKVDASGKLGGGTVLLGGDYQGKNPGLPHARQVAVGKEVTIAADAIDSGNGGKVIVWGDETARVFGSISARAGALSGDGGLVETSGHYLDVQGVRIDTRAARGKAGNWLLDPYDIQVVPGFGGNFSDVGEFASGPASGMTTIGADQIANAQADVTLQALHRIDFDAEISMVYAGVGVTAMAGEQINVNAPITTKGGMVVLSANDNGGGSAAGAGGVLHLYAAIDTGNNDLTLSGASVSGYGAINAGAGNLKITANSEGGAINLSGARYQVTGSGSGQNVDLQADNMNLAGGFGYGGGAGAVSMTLRPWTNSRGINLGSNSDSSVLGLSADDLAGLSVGYVTIGDAEGSGTIKVSAPLSLVAGAGSAIRRLDLRTGSGGAINIDHALTLDGGLSVAGGSISAAGAVNLGGEFVLAGAWRQNSAALPAFSAGRFRIESGAFLRVAGGDGSTAAPYRIADVYGLQGIKGLDLGASFIMANNIEGGVTANWNEGQGFAPLASGDGPGFSGVFDGAGYAIRDLKIGGNHDATGLFSVINGATLRNLTLSGGSVSGNRNVGALAGTVLGGTISNVSSSMAVSGADNTGGLVGSNAGAISNASASGSVNLQVSEGGAATGGLVGKNQAAGTITASYASGAVSSAREFVGGLVGDNDGAVTQSYATGATRGARDVGGLAGRNAGSINDAYASGAVSLSSNADPALQRQNLGGFVGASPGTVSHAYSSGQVNPDGFDAGTYGAVAGSAAGSFGFGFFNYESAGIVTDNSGSSGRSTAQMMQASSFNGYDFSSVWRLYDGRTTPLLKATLKPLTVEVSNTPSNIEYAGAPVLFSGTLAYTGLLNGDSAADGSAGYGAARNVGNYHVGGLWSTKYDISYSGATALTITARALGVSVSGSKVYDGGTGFSAAALALTNVVAGDEMMVGVNGSAAFADKNAGAAKTVNLTGLSLVGDGASNYSLASSSATGSATIAVRALNVGGVSGVSRVYDGSLAATISGALEGAVSGDQVSLAGVGASFADKHTGSAKLVTYSVQASNLAGADAANYSLIPGSGSTTADITARTLTSTYTGVNKVYDGGSSASVTIGDNRIAGDVLSVTATGAFGDKNAAMGKTVSVSGATLSGVDAGNYVLASSTGSTTANITARALSTWTGAAGGLWSDAANWEDGVAPDAANVLAATVAAGSGSITYDAAAGNTVLNTINFGRGLNLTGGSLTIGHAATDSASLSSLHISGGKLALTGALAVADYAQTGGALDGSGNLAVSNSFSQSAGSIALGGALSASQGSGDLVFASLAAQSISLSAAGGAIAQSGAVVTASLTTQSQSGTTLNNPGNRIANFTASNSGAGGIALTNTTAQGQLLLAGLSTGSGNIVIDNTGAVETHAINANGGNVSVTARDAVMVRGVIQGNDVALTAGTDITLDGAAALSAGRALALDATASIALNGTSSLAVGTAGSMSLLARSANISAVNGVQINSHGAPLTLRAPLGTVRIPASVFASGTLPVINGVSTPMPGTLVLNDVIRDAINTINVAQQAGTQQALNGGTGDGLLLALQVKNSDSKTTTGSKENDSIKKTFCN